MLIDSHCHLSSDEIYQDLENVIKRAKENGVGYFLNAASKFDELDLQLQISSSFSNIYGNIATPSQNKGHSNS